MESIYGEVAGNLDGVRAWLEERLRAYNAQVKEESGEGIYEHILARVKSEESMREKLSRRELEATPENALTVITDSIGIRIITRFVDDIYTLVEYIRSMEDCRVVREKDYIRHAKPNGYRSYHMILELTVPYEDIRGDNPGHYYAEIQLRTIAMDSWASLEHQLKYKQEIAHAGIIVEELKRCADELASCDLSMQTIRNLIRESK